jgi:hypothetical protein
MAAEVRTMKRDLIVARAKALGIEVSLAQGFDEAIIGIGWQFTQPMVVYDREKCIQVLMERDGMSREDADEFFDFNVSGAYVGKDTPVFVETCAFLEGIQQ